MIERLKNKEVYNPIRDHISIGFELVPNLDEIMSFICNDLKTKGFNQDKSRGLIFVPTRKKTEEITEFLRNKLSDWKLPYANKIDFYHAGLEGIEREEKYDQFNSGETVILVATKAFGMGMDIKNIHYIYHVGPSSTFEDYLQEVGRAGRHKQMLIEAGFSTDNPIKTTCLLLPDDFKKMKDKLHDSQITWNQLDQTRETVFEYVKQFQELKPNDDKAFALPLDLLVQSTGFEDIFNTDTFFRVALYWLEKLKRIQLGVYTPTQLPIRLTPNKEKKVTFYKNDEEQVIGDLINSLTLYKQEKFPDSDLLMIEMNKLREFISQKGQVDILQLLFKAQRLGYLVVERIINLVPTKTRITELEKWVPGRKFLILEATFEFAFELLNHTILGDQKSFDGEYLDNLIKGIAANYFIPDNIFWTERKRDNEKELSRDKIALKLKDDFIEKRAKFAFKLIGFLPKMRHKSIIEVNPDTEHPVITQLIYNGYKNNNDWKDLLKEFKKDLYQLFQVISTEFIKNKVERFNIVDLIVRLKIEEKENEYFQQLVYMAKALAYLKGSGSLIPMGVELFLKDLKPFSEKDRSSLDYLVFNEFNESNQMRELRLLALECLSNIAPNDYDQYIKNYFRSASTSDIIKLLEEKLGEDHENLKAFRIEALEKAKKLLNDEQRVVYDSGINNNIQVIAGPGSGKTHTLTLRVARLIQEEKVKPETILVLAYNRAVVVELKERLGRLFSELGYGKLINRLKVFTFHGFCRYCLNDELNDLDFDKWTSTFIRKARNEPGIIAQKLGNIKYVFVDEFQDITGERMELLKLIAHPDKTKVCVIGDPNQSIYGYERVNAGDTMDPKPYYEKFKDIYNPIELDLIINYRSYPEILEKAEELLDKNKSKFPMKPFEAMKNPPPDEKYCHIITHKQGERSWQDWLKEILNAKDQFGKVKFHQVAIMFRTNDEVYRAYNLLKKENLENIRIRIQGGKSSPYRSREFYHLLNSIESKSEQLLENQYIEQFKNEKLLTLKEFPNWNEYLINLFHCILIEFNKIKEENSTYADLIDFISDISHKDDGQFGKIYQNNINKIVPDLKEQEIVVTTMHKVKGIEFDTVIVPPSFSNLPIKEIDEALLTDFIEEERRLYYVAYTRAKHKLVAIKHHREIALDDGFKFKFPEEKIQKIGIVLPEGIDKLNISWGADRYGENSFDFIKNKVKIGDDLVLKKEEIGTHEFWNIYIGNNKVGQLNSKTGNKLNGFSSMSGFNISSIERYTYAETIEYDKKHNTSFAQKWTDISKSRGYIYLIDFSGFGKEN